MFTVCTKCLLHINKNNTKLVEVELRYYFLFCSKPKVYSLDYLLCNQVNNVTYYKNPF